MKQMYLNADEVADILGVAKSTAYGIIRQWNKELKAQNYFTVAGKIPSSYLYERCYGIGEETYENKESED